MSRKYIKPLSNSISLVIFLIFLFFPTFSETKEWLLPIFDLEKPPEENLADQMNSLKKSLTLDIDQLIQLLNDCFDQPGSPVTLYLRNDASSDFLLTDTVLKIDNKVSHYHSSLDKPEFLYRDTIQRISIPDIPPGEHTFNLAFLCLDLSTPGETGKKNPPPMKPCTFLSDSYCLHQKPFLDTRILKKCSFHMPVEKDRTLSFVISLDDSNVPHLVSIPPLTLERFRVELEMARGLYRNGNYLKCLGIIKTIERNFFDLPQLEEARFLEAECFFQLRMYDKAIQSYQQLLKKFPQGKYIRASRLGSIMAYYLSGKYDAVISEFGHITRLRVEGEFHDPARYVAAKSYYRKKEYNRTEDILKSISRKSPYYPEAQYLQSLCCLKSGQYHMAALALEKAIKSAESLIPYSIWPEMHGILEHGLNIEDLIQDSHILLGKVLYRQKQYQKAHEEFEKIPTGSGYYPAALTGKGLASFQSGEREEIKKIIEELSKIGLENYFLADARLSFACQAQQEGRYSEARSYLKDTLDRCQAALSAIELFQGDPKRLEDFILSFVSRKEPRSEDFPAVAFLYQEIKDHSGLKTSLGWWDMLLDLEETLLSMENLLFEPMHAYQKKAEYHLRSKDGGPEVNPSTPFNRGPAQIQEVYQSIQEKRGKLREIKQALLSQIDLEIAESIRLVTDRLAELRDRANLEIMMMNLQENFSPFHENRSQGFSSALGEIADRHESFLDKHLKSPYREKILFQLAEGYYQKAVIDFQLQLQAADTGQNPADFLVETKPDFDQAIKTYGLILTEFPRGDYSEKVFYTLGYIYQEQGAVILAKDFFHHLLNNYPESPLRPEVLLRLGEISFDENKFAEATDYYEQSMKLGKFPEQYRNNVSYKLGWSYYQQNQYEKSFEVFISLANHYLQAEKFDLLSEITYQLAKILIEYNSWEQVRKVLHPLEDKPYHFRILQEYGSILFDRGKYEEAVTADHEAIERHPMHPAAPLLQSEIEKCYLAMDNPSGANTAREMLITNYGENTSWWKGNDDEKLRAQVAFLIDESIRRSTMYLMESKDKEEYQKIVDFYRENLDHLPTDEQVYTINFFLAECLFKTGQYEKALIEYEQILQDEQFDQFMEEAAYKQILCLEKIIHEQSNRTSTISQSEEWTSEEKKFLAACDYMWHTLPNHQHLPQVLYKKGELYFRKAQYPEAVQVFTHIIQTYPESQIRIAALKMLAKIHFDQQQFDRSAHIYSQIVNDYDHMIKKERSKDAVEMRIARQKAYKMKALAKYKAVELHKEQDPLKAAEEYQTIANDFPEIQIADGALFEAARIYQTHTRLEEARAVYGRILERYPQSEYAPLALLQIALHHEKSNHFQMAAQSYEKLFIDYPAFPESHKALYKAGLLYEKLENWDKVIKIFSIYHTELQPGASLAIESLFRKGYALMKHGQPAKADAAFHVVVDSYEQYKEHDEALSAYYPAWAQFLIGEMAGEALSNLKIQGVIDQAGQPKLALVKKVIENYSKVIDFNIAEWTTAALFKMGRTMDIFAEEEAGENIPAPQGKEEEAGENIPAPGGEYDESAYLLHIQSQQKVIDLLEKAVLFHQRNVELAKKGNLHNSWISQSQESLTKDYWMMGRLYERIYTLIKEAPVPPVLDEKEAREYQEALLSKALPYRNQAIDQYLENTLFLKQDITLNTWIDQSFQRLADLKPKSYLRNEARLPAEDRSFLEFPRHLLIR